MHWLVDELTLLTGNHLFSRLFVVSAVVFFLGFVITFVFDWLGIDAFPFASDETEKHQKRCVTYYLIITRNN